MPTTPATCVTVAETTNALDATPGYQFTDMNGGEIYHHGDICNSEIPLRHRRTRDRQ